MDVFNHAASFLVQFLSCYAIKAYPILFYPATASVSAPVFAFFFPETQAWKESR
jgi:hypothetical protein